MSRSPYNGLVFIGCVVGAALLFAPLFIPTFYQQIEASVGLGFYFLAALVGLGFYLGVVFMIRLMTGW